MKKLVLVCATVLVLFTVSKAGERFYFSVNLGYPACSEKRVVYVEKRPKVILVEPAPVYRYAPYERVIVVEKVKGKHWKRHPHWDW